LQGTTGVQSLAVSIKSADDVTLASALPTVTTVQATKTATFVLPATLSRTYLVRALINGGIDQNGDTVAAYDKSVAVHILTGSGNRLIAVGEKDEYSRAYGYTPKLNTAIQNTSAVVGSSGVVSGTYTHATVTVDYRGIVTSCATGSTALASSGVVSGTYVNPTMTVDYRGIVTSCATGSVAAVSGTFAIGTGATAVNLVESSGALRVENASGALNTMYASTYKASAGTIYLREGAAGRGNGTITISQATGSDVTYGWDEALWSMTTSRDGGSTQSRIIEDWVPVYGYTATAASASSLTMTVDTTGYVSKGDAVRWESSAGGYRYGVVASIASALLTIRPGMPLNDGTAATVAGLWFGASALHVVPVLMNLPGTYAVSASSTALWAYAKVKYPWLAKIASLAWFSITPYAVNAGSKPSVNVYVNGALASSDNGNAGPQCTAAGTEVAAAVLVPANCEIEQGEFIEAKVTAPATSADDTNLTIAGQMVIH